MNSLDCMTSIKRCLLPFIRDCQYSSFSMNIKVNNRKRCPVLVVGLRSKNSMCDIELIDFLNELIKVLFLYAEYFCCFHCLVRFLKNSSLGFLLPTSHNGINATWKKSFLF